MAIVPNLNGVQISNNTPLVDPRNLSWRERTATDDNFSTESRILLVDNNQNILSNKQTRNTVMFMNPDEADLVVYLSTASMTVAGQGVPLYPGNGFTFRGKAAQAAFYVWGVAGQYLTVLEG